MTIVTESELRELWQNGRGQVPAFPPDTRFSDAAREFMRNHQLDAQTDSSAAAAWDKPSVFPVALSGPQPVCNECGQPIKHKPDYMTQLDAGHFASKTNPRLILRGRVDSLHALILLTAAKARGFNLPALAGALDTLAAYCREIMSAEYHLRVPAPLSFLNLSEEELHKISHRPDQHVGIPHLTLGSDDHEILHWLNVARAQAREVEVTALEAFGFAQGHDVHAVGLGLSHALNRFSSAVYVLELYVKAGKLN